MNPHDPARTPRRVPMRRLPALLALPLVGACFTYTGVGVEDVAPGESVRIRVFERAAGRLPARLERRTQFEGTVVDLDGERLNLLPELGSAATDPLSVEVSDIQAVSRRELNRGRTWLAVGAGAALGAGVLLWIEGEPAGTGGGGPITEFMLGWTLPLGG